MSSYILTGSADNEQIAQCEYVSNLITKIQPNIDIRIVIKDKDEWDQHIYEVCRTYGFTEVMNPLVYKTDGTFVGGSEKFLSFADKNFNINLDHYDSNVRSSAINQKVIHKEIKQRKILQKGKRTLNEKIQDKIQSNLLSGNLKITDGSYQKISQNGLTFFYKYEQQHQLKIEVPLRISIAQERLDDQEDVDFEKLGQQDYFEDKPEEQDQLLQSSVEESLTVQQSLQQTSVEQQPVENQEEQVVEKPKKMRLKQMYPHTELVFDEDLVDTSNNQPKVIEISPELVIKNFKDGYSLVLHPSPIVNGQCLIIQNQSKEKSVKFYDLSQVKIIARNSNKIQKNDSKDMDLCEKNVFQLFSKKQLKTIVKILKKTNGYVFTQHLPNGSQNPFPNQSNMVHFLSRESLVNLKNNSGFQQQENLKHEVPQFENYFLNADKKHKFFYIKTQKEEYETDTDIDEFVWEELLDDEQPKEVSQEVAEGQEQVQLELTPKQQQQQRYEEFLKIQELKTQARQERLDQQKIDFYKDQRQRTFYQNNLLEFPHLIYKIQKEPCTKIRKIIRDMITSLHIDFKSNMQNHGLNLIISKNFVFVAPISQPQTIYEGQYLFPSIFSYFGVVHLPLIEQQWPQTSEAQNTSQQIHFYRDILKKCAQNN